MPLMQPSAFPRCGVRCLPMAGAQEAGHGRLQRIMAACFARFRGCASASWSACRYQGVHLACVAQPQWAVLLIDGGPVGAEVSSYRGFRGRSPSRTRESTIHCASLPHVTRFNYWSVIPRTFDFRRLTAAYTRSSPRSGERRRARGGRVRTRPGPRSAGPHTRRAARRPATARGPPAVGRGHPAAAGGCAVQGLLRAGCAWRVPAPECRCAAVRSR